MEFQLDININLLVAAFRFSRIIANKDGLVSFEPGRGFGAVYGKAGAGPLAAMLEPSFP